MDEGRGYKFEYVGTDTSWQAPNEAQFVDKDIAEAFSGQSVLVGTMSLVQLNRNITKLIEVLQSENQKEHS